MIGEVLEGYELTLKLGDGGTGETYLGVHRESGQKAAVKVLFAELSSDAALVAHFLAEVKTASQVNHIGIADLFACGVHKNGRVFLVMELIEGKTLTDALIDLGSVSDMESFADVGWQLATLLDAVHETGIVHGALKPDGIFMTFPPERGGRALVKLLDFGTAKLSLNIRHSQTGSLLGAPLYMSPEASRGLGNLDRRADVYSLGCILFEMTCGRPPFVREGKGELIIAHATETPPSVASLEPSVPQSIDTLIGRMLTKNPATRPQGMADVASVLERFVKRAVPAESLATPLPPPASASAVALPTLPAPAAPVPVGPALSGSLLAAASPPRPTQRRPDPTALLPPSSMEVPMQQTWIARVHQTTTAIIEPTDTRRPVPHSSSAQRESLASRPAGAFRTLVASVNLPVVILTASVIITVGTAIILLRSRRPPPSRESRAPLVERKTPTHGDDGFPRAALAEPVSAQRSARLLPSADEGAVPFKRTADDGMEAPRGPEAASSGRDKTERKPPAKRW